MRDSAGCRLRVPAEVVVIDRRNFHLFQPLLYQEATAGLTPSDIAWPIRSILRDQANARVVLGEVIAVDRLHREVRLADGTSFAYDWLVVATGATHGYMDNEHWMAVAPGLKRVDDATRIRRRILMAFEHAELSRKALARDFRRIDPRQTRITLLEGGPRLLSTFPESLSHRARRALELLGVQVRTSTRVSACDERGVEAGGERIQAANVLWAAGVRASPAAAWLDAPVDTAGRVEVRPDLSVPGHPEIFVVGDTAAVPPVDRRPVPCIAPAAKQAGCHAAAIIAAELGGRPRPGPFRYRHRGSLATIGRHQAVIDFGWIRLWGWPAWWVWGLAHVYFLIGIRNRLFVAMHWFFSYLTFGRGARLIAGSEAGGAHCGQ